MTDRIWSIEYELGGKLFAMQMFGTALEVTTHAENLGLGTPEPLAINVPCEFELIETGRMH